MWFKLKILKQLRRLRREQRDHHVEMKELLMSKFKSVNDALTRIDEATTAVASELRDLKNQIAEGMTPSEARAVQDRAEQLATHLEGIGKDESNPTPEIPPPVTPEPTPESTPGEDTLPPPSNG